MPETAAETARLLHGRVRLRQAVKVSGVRTLSMCLAGLLLAVLSVGASAGGAKPASFDRESVRAATRSSAVAILARLPPGERTRLIVGLDVSTVPESKLLRPQVTAQRDRIARAQERLLQRLQLLPARVS